VSSITWTRAELSSELTPLTCEVWRAVEAQHRISTMKLVDSVEDQGILEEEIEASKPPVPPECRPLDYLLYTPFRYHSRYPTGSRFRRAGLGKGVFYGSAAAATAMAERAFLQLLVFAESPDTPFPGNPLEFTVFAVPLQTPFALDLTQPPLARDKALWSALSDYRPCQDLADVARECSAEALQYTSVRDPDGGRNFAVLSCCAFAASHPVGRQPWHMQLQRHAVWAKCEAPAHAVTFDMAHFLADPRLAALGIAV
jgi:hypothetical protein